MGYWTKCLNCGEYLRNGDHSSCREEYYAKQDILDPDLSPPEPPQVINAAELLRIYDSGEYKIHEGYQAVKEWFTKNHSRFLVRFRSECAVYSCPVCQHWEYFSAELTNRRIKEVARKGKIEDAKLKAEGVMLAMQEQMPLLRDLIYKIVWEALEAREKMHK